MKDPIERQDAIDTVFKFLGKREIARTIQTALWILPTAQQDCTECPEYDHETKSCPKYCEVIRQTLAEAQPECTGRWIDYVEDGYVECPFCHSATNCDGNISELHFCFSCGARLEGEG